MTFEPLLTSYEILENKEKYPRENFLYRLQSNINEQKFYFRNASNKYAAYKALITEAIENKILSTNELTTIRLMNLVDETQMLRERLHSLEITKEYLDNEVKKFEQKIIAENERKKK